MAHDAGKHLLMSGGCAYTLGQYLYPPQFCSFQGLNKVNYRRMQERQMTYAIKRQKRRTFIWSSIVFTFVLRVWENHGLYRATVPYLYKAARLENPFVINNSIQVGEALYAYFHTKPTRFHTDQ